MKSKFYLLLPVLLAALFLGACDGSNSGKTDPQVHLTIDLPSETERVLAEKRDFIVFGRFESPLDKPGDVRVEVYGGLLRRRPHQSGREPCRSGDGGNVLRRPVSGLSSGNVVAGGSDPFMTPDLVKKPGGFLDPGNKCVVTNEYYAAVVLGGASKEFDTTTADGSGRR